VVACGERFRGVALVSGSSLVGASWSAASFGGPLAAALMKAVGNDAMVAVPMAAALAFLAAVWWEKQRAPMQADMSQ
jgi:hypothetical protein